MEEDPILSFFSTSESEDPDILYSTLDVPRAATAEEVRKGYRRLALKFHPDKQVSKSAKEKEELGREFQKVGFAYAVLSDEARRKRYDATGRTDERFADAEEMGWDAYFESLYQRVDRKMLDEDRERYQGSQEELDDLVKAYNDASGSLPKILDHIPHSGYADEPRLIAALNSLISTGRLASNSQWTKTSGDIKASNKRGKAAEKEAKEAEATAKELGVWEEFYGSGVKGKRNEPGAAEKKKRKSDGGAEDGLAALILKRQKDREGGLDRLAEKYAKLEEEERAKRKAKAKSRAKGKKDAEEEEEEEEEEEGASAAPPDLSDADFEALQAKLFGDKVKGKGKKVKA